MVPAWPGMAWLLAHDPSILLIPGTSSLGHLRGNLDVADVVLDPEAMTRRDALG